VDTNKRRIQSIIPERPLPAHADKKMYAGLLVGLALQDVEVFQHLRNIVKGLDDGSWEDSRKESHATDRHDSL
jgi:hypothetical protein